MNNLKFSVVLEGVVSPNGGDPEADGIAMTREELNEHLNRAIMHLFSNGLITGNTPATVEEHGVRIEVSNAE